MAPKSEQLQIRLTPRQKALLKRRARAAGLDVSAYVLSRALPDTHLRVSEAVASLREGADRRFALAEVSDALAALVPAEFADAVDAVDVRGLPPLLQNYVAAMVEQSAQANGVAAPAWTRAVRPLDEPYFATTLKIVRPYLLRVTPIAFKRRNLFADAGVGTRAWRQGARECTPRRAQRR